MSDDDSSAKENFDIETVLRSFDDKESRQKLIKNHTEANLHKCALSWSNKCAHCGKGFDDFKQTIETSIKVRIDLFLLFIIYIKLYVKWIGIQQDFQAKMEHKIPFVNEEMDIRYESLREDLELVKDKILLEIDETEKELFE